MRIKAPYPAVEFGTFPSRRVESWSRSTRYFGGYWDGVFTLNDTVDIADIFDRMLGYDVSELGGGIVPQWEGFIYEMVLHDTIDKIRSYKGLYNSVMARARNLLTNGGFETGDFTGWSAYSGGAGSVTIETDNVGRGVYAARLHSGNGGTQDTWLDQTVPIVDHRKFRLTFYYDDTDGPEVRYMVFTDVGDVLPEQEVKDSRGRYRRYTVDFIVQKNASEMTIRLMTPATNNTTSLFDDVRIELIADEKPVPSTTPFATNLESVSEFGTVEYVQSGTYMEYQNAIEFRDDLLALSAFPKMRRGRISSSAGRTLDVYVRGYIETLRFKIWKADAGGAYMPVKNILQYIKDANEFVLGFAVTGDPPDVLVADAYTRTQYAVLESLQTKIGKDYRIYMASGRILTCEPAVYEPKYYMRGGQIYRSLTSAIAGLHPRVSRGMDITPGVVRDMDAVLSGTEPDSRFLDRRDFLMSNVEIDQDGFTFST